MWCEWSSVTEHEIIHMKNHSPAQHVIRISQTCYSLKEHELTHTENLIEHERIHMGEEIAIHLFEMWQIFLWCKTLLLYTAWHEWSISFKFSFFIFRYYKKNRMILTPKINTITIMGRSSNKRSPICPIFQKCKKC